MPLTTDPFLQEDRNGNTVIHAAARNVHEWKKFPILKRMVELSNIDINRLNNQKENVLALVVQELINFQQEPIFDVVQTVAHFLCHFCFAYFLP